MFARRLTALPLLFEAQRFLDVATVISHTQISVPASVSVLDVTVYHRPLETGGGGYHISIMPASLQRDIHVMPASRQKAIYVMPDSRQKAISVMPVSR
jgi:hypothetical protein